MAENDEFVDSPPPPAIKRSVQTLDEWIESQIRDGRGTDEFKDWLKAHRKR